MKTAIRLFAAVLIIASVSCMAPIQYGYQNPGQGQQQQGGQNGRQITSYKKVAYTTTLRAFVKLGADAPQMVVDRAEQATANQVGFEYAQSFESGGKPVWPSYTRVTQIAGQKLAANGHRLTPGQPGQPGCFKVMKYTPGVK